MCGCNKRPPTARVLRSVAAPAPATRSVVAPAPATRSVVAPAPATRSVAAPAPATRSVAAPAPATRSVAAPAPAPVSRVRFTYARRVNIVPRPRPAQAPRSSVGRHQRAAAVPYHTPIVNTTIWGPPLWKVLHVAAEMADGSGTEPLWRELVPSLHTSLPCPVCAGHFRDWATAHPLPAVLDRTVLREWWAALHNDVNRRNRRPLWSVETVAATYGTAEAGTEAAAALETLRPLIGSAAWTLLSRIVHG
jgi:hypothetical protein